MDLTGLTDLGTPVLVGIGALVVLQLTLMVLALISVIRRHQSAIRGPKWLWVLIIIFGELIGPIVYFAVARLPEQVDIKTASAAASAAKADEVVDVLYGDASGSARQ